jgi:protein-tyrosine-phosphatase
MNHVLFVCLHNAGRSQISQALFERAAAGRHTADSAGSVADPNGSVHPESSRSCANSIRHTSRGSAPKCLLSAAGVPVGVPLRDVLGAR